MLLWLVASSSWYQVTEGLSSASFCLTFRADSSDFSASAGLPLSCSMMPMLSWVCARPATNVGDGGIVVGQLLIDRRADSSDSSASARLPASWCT